jgi:hypothetical protein
MILLTRVEGTVDRHDERLTDMLAAMSEIAEARP